MEHTAAELFEAPIHDRYTTYVTMRVGSDHRAKSSASSESSASRRSQAAPNILDCAAPKDVVLRVPIQRGQRVSLATGCPGMYDIRLWRAMFLFQI